jgi:SAM-dependent methyltransferase
MFKHSLNQSKSNDSMPGFESFNLWYQSPLGLHLLEKIKGSLDKVLSTSFGYYALSVGCESLSREILENCRVKHLFRIGQGEQDIDVNINNTSLPIASDSTDLVVLIHALSQSADPHGLLREVNRVLIPDGKLIIIDFNPISLWGLRHLFQSWLEDAPWAGHYYTAQRLKDWTSLLGFEQLHHYRCGYVLPLNYQKLLQRSRILSKFSERWLTFSGAINVLVFEKNTIPLTPIRKRWVKNQILSPKVVRPTVGRGMKYDK